MIKNFLLSFLISNPIIADCQKMSRPGLDGGLMVFEEEDHSIRIYDGRYRESLSEKNILWKWRVRDVRDSDFVFRFTRTKNDVKQVLFQGELHLLIVSSRGDGVALIHFDSGKLVYHKKVLGSIHSAAMAPNDNILLADAKGYARLLSTSSGKISSCSHSSAHGAVWDKEQELMWVWGSGGRMVGYPISGTKTNPKLECGRARHIEAGPGGGHDLQPMLDGSRMLIGSSGPHIFFFNTDLDWPEGPWGFIQKYPRQRGIKGVSRNSKTGEIVYVRNDRSNDIKYRSNVIRSLDGRTRTLTGKTAMYKIRWFQPDCFSF